VFIRASREDHWARRIPEAGEAREHIGEHDRVEVANVRGWLLVS
jgi:hypothetical protein